MADRSTTGMLEAAGSAAPSRAGDSGAGEFRCTACGYGIAVQRVLPLCPMCGGAAWEPRPASALRFGL